MNIFDYGFEPAGMPAGDKWIPARITSAHGGYFKFFCDEGEGVARLKASAYRDQGGIVPTTGDFVRLEWNPCGESRILSTLPRRTFLERRDPSSSGYQAQALAANVDTAFFLMSLNQNFSVRRMERYLTLVWQSGATPVVVLTKTDLMPDFMSRMEEIRAAAGDVEVYAVSAKEGTGLDALAKYIQPRKTMVFLGSSGVGKSSLVNALAGEEWMPTLEIREWDGKGRHTTTERELVVLPCGAMIIDTPGMREIGLWEASDGLNQAFGDVEAFLGQCRFSDCKHNSEPGCAVRAALENGDLPQERWEAYRRLQEEVATAESRKEFLAAKKAKFKAIARINKAGHRYR